MSMGIYCYRDKETKEIVYIGKDSNIHEKQRDYAHRKPSQYNTQPFNKILQNNIERYEYSIICEYDILTTDELNTLEINYIKKYNPRFNFTKGGDGGCIERKAKTKRKISNTLAKEKTSTGIKNFSIKNPSKTHNYIRYGYNYYDENGIRKNKVSKDIKKIYDFVIENNLPWIIIDEEKAKKYLDML